MSTSTNTGWTSTGPLLACVILLSCAGFLRVEVKMKEQEIQIDDLKAQLSSQSFLQKYIVTAIFDYDIEEQNVKDTTNVRIRRDATPPSNSTPSAIKEQLLKKLDRLISEASLKICADKGAVCLPGPSGPPGEPGSRGQKGSRGRRGYKGRAGHSGTQGIKGQPGRSGKQGIMGLSGVRGERGKRGDAGPQGMPGLKGEPGESISAPSVVISPTSPTVNESEAVSMQCSAGGNPEPVIMWNKVGGSLPAGRSAVFGGKLEVQKSQIHDTGVYQCTASNVLGVSKKQVKLNVNGRPRISLNRGPLLVKEGSNIVLPVCQVTGHPKAIVIWKRTTQPIPMQRASVTRNTLRINSVYKNDTDAYTCQASNLLGSNSATTFLVVVGLPHFSLKPPEKVYFYEGETLTIKCGAVGDPQPVISWRREGGQLPEDRTVIKDGLLTMRNMRKQDAGKYVCAATSAAISDVEATTRVTPDVDECKENKHNCSTDAACQNTKGSFNCKCNSGFFGNGVNCTDVDECIENKHNCSANATCQNTQGSFNCKCNSGFIGDGVNCIECKKKTKKGGCCVFPFIYRGMSYNSCTTKDNGNVPWCATTANYDTDGQWGICHAG